MPFPRFFPDQVSNNVALTVGAAAILLLATLTIMALLQWTLRRATRSARREAIKSAAAQVEKSVRFMATVVSLLVVVAGCATLGIAIMREIDLHPWAQRLAGHARIVTGQDLLWGLGIVAAVAVGWLIWRAALDKILGGLTARLLAVAPAPAPAPIPRQDEEIRSLRQRISSLANVAFFYGLYRLTSARLSLPPSLHWLLHTVLYVLLVVYFARAAARIAVLSLEALDRVAAARLESSPLNTYYLAVRKLRLLARRILEAITYLAAATLIVGQFQTLEAFAPYGPRIIQLLGTFFASRVLVELSRVVLFESLGGATQPTDETDKHRLTLIHLLQSVVTYVIYFGAALIMLDQIGIDTKPFLAGAGIVGLAVGLGAQKLVADMVSGFFILFEGHLLKDDYVRIGDCEGTVHSVQLRVTLIRDGFGRLFTFRNADIGTIINFSRDYVHGVVDVPVDLGANLNQVFEALTEAGRRLEEACRDRVLAKLVIRGATKIAQDGIVIRVAVKLTAGDPDPVPRVLRKLIKEAFDERGLRLANANQLAVLVTNGSPEDGRS